MSFDNMKDSDVTKRGYRQRDNNKNRCNEKTGAAIQEENTERQKYDEPAITNA